MINKDIAKYFLSFPTGLENNWISACLLAHWESGNEKLFAPHENVIVLGYRTTPL